MADNLSQQLEINKAIKKRQEMLEQQTAEMEKQLNVSKQLFAVQKSLSGTSLDDIISQLENMQGALSDVREEQEETFDSFGDIIKNASRNATSFGGVWKNIKSSFGKFTHQVKKSNPVIFSFFSGFADGLSFSLNLVKSFTGLITTAIKGLFQLGTAILSIPFKFLEGLFALANKMTAMWVENAKAVEEVRKQFGELATGTGKQVMDAFRGLGGVMGTFGASMYSVFGTVAERAQFVNKLFTDMGAIVHSFGRELYENIETVGLYQKALGISAETMGDMGIRAKSMGNTLTEELKRTADMAFSLGRQFVGSGKVVARAVGDMVKDVEHFGTLSVKTMAESATYVKSLGLEVKSLAGIVDKFLNFEDAAMSAAKLSQVFGANIDALQMMGDAGKDPAKAFNTLQKAMFRAGRTTDDMTQAELRFLAKTTGLTAQEAKLAFSMKARGKTLEEIKKASSEASDTQLTLEQSLQNVQGAVHRLVKSIPEFKGFFDAFLKGFSRGLVHSTDFHKSLRDLNKSAMAVARGGIKIGKAFMDSFPGVQQFWQGFQKLFNPKEVKKLMDRFVAIFKDFGKMLTNPSDFPMKGSPLQFLFDSIKNEFEQFFNINDELKSGFKTFATTIRDLIVQSAPIIIGGLADLFNIITGLIQNPEQFTDPTKAGAKGVAGFLSPIAIAFKNAWKDKKMGDALMNFATLAIDTLVDILYKVIKTYKWETAIIVLGPAIAGAVFQALTTAFFTMIPWGAVGGFLLKGLKLAFTKLPIIGLVATLGLTLFRIFEKWGEEKTFWGKVSLIFREGIKSVLDVLTLGLWRFIPDLDKWIDEATDYIISGFKTGMKAGIDEITNGLNRTGKWIVEKWNWITNQLSMAWEGFKMMLSDGWNFIIKGIKSFVSVAWGFLKDNFPLFKLIDLLSQEDFRGKMETLGQSMLEGLEEGFKKIKDLLPGSLKTAIEVVKKVLDARSPSRVFMGIGDNMSQGIKLGVQDIPNHMDKVMSRAVSNSENTLKQGLGTIHGMTQRIEKDLNSMPTFDIDARMGSNMKIKDKPIEIKHKDLNLSVNLNVVLEADQLATALAKTKKLVAKGSQFD